MKRVARQVQRGALPSSSHRQPPSPSLHSGLDRPDNLAIGNRGANRASTTRKQPNLWLIVAIATACFVFARGKQIIGRACEATPVASRERHERHPSYRWRLTSHRLWASFFPCCLDAWPASFDEHPAAPLAGDTSSDTKFRPRLEETAQFILSLKAGPSQRDGK